MKAIDRFVHPKINITPVYATYTSWEYSGFYASEEEAIAHCDKYRYTVFPPGGLFAIGDNVYVSEDESKFIDPIGGMWQMPFTKWSRE